MSNSQEKLALITGGAVRVGKYIATKLADSGWRIALHYNSSEKEALELARELIPKTDIILFKADLSDSEQAIKLMSDVKEQMGEVSLLINNASIYKNDNINNITLEGLLHNLNVHLTSPLFLSQAMTQGNIINILDAEITDNLKKFFSYSLSKKALLSLTKMMAVSLAPSVRVNAIAPGPILFKEGLVKEVFDQLVSASPLRIKANLQDLHQTIEFLVNTNSVTGQCIFLDGGLHLQ